MLLMIKNSENCKRARLASVGPVALQSMHLSEDPGVFVTICGDFTSSLLQ